MTPVSSGCGDPGTSRAQRGVDGSGSQLYPAIGATDHARAAIKASQSAHAWWVQHDRPIYTRLGVTVTANVTSVELDPALAQAARQALVDLGWHPAVHAADGAAGLAAAAPFDRIIATASTDHIPRVDLSAHPWWDRSAEPKPRELSASAPRWEAR